MQTSSAEESSPGGSPVETNARGRTMSTETLILVDEHDR